MQKTHNLVRGVTWGIPRISKDHLILWFLQSQQRTLIIIEGTLSWSYCAAFQKSLGLQ